MRLEQALRLLRALARQLAEHFGPSHPDDPSQSMIACAYCGRENDAAATHCRECGTALPSKPVAVTPPEAPPELSAPKFVNPEALETAFGYEDGFHRADWDVIGQWIDSKVAPLDAEAAWDEAVLLWTTKLRDDLGGNYHVLQSRQTVLLCDQPLDTAQWILDYAGRAAITIKEVLGQTAWSGAFGKDVVLVFSDEDDYYQYLSYHSPDGEQAASGGVCIHSGCTHIALPWNDQLGAANTIVHELTHDCLAHLPLPLWLNEGVAVTLQNAIAPLGFANAPIMPGELADRHFAFWTGENIQSFWAGTSFYQPGDPNELSYGLAQIFVKFLLEQGDADAFRTFLEVAQRDDAGQTAALDILGANLGEIAGTFLGEGNWRPQRKAMIACWESAGWEKSEDDDAASREDGSEAKA
jgi:hypothetical protein